MKGKKFLGTVLTLALGCCVGAAACLIPANWDKITGGSQNEQIVDPGPVNPNKAPKPTDKQIPYKIKNGLIVEYSGKDTEITLPATYSYDSGYRIYNNASDFEKELKSFYPECETNWSTVYLLTVKDAFGFETTIQNYGRFKNIKSYPVSARIGPPRFLEGDDIKIIGIETLGNLAKYSATLVNIPEGYTTLKLMAFKSFTALTTVNCPTTLKEIQANCFNGCSNLKNFNFENITQIGSSAFYGTNLENVNLPNVNTLGNSVFQNCTSLRTVNLERSNITVLSSSCFNSCSNLSNITLPDTLTQIESSVFYKCTQLKELTLPKNVDEIVYNFCGANSNLPKLIIQNDKSIIRITEDKPLSITADCEVIVPDNLYDAYMADPNWNLSNITIVKASEAT